MLYGIIRMAEPAREHVDNNFSPIEPEVSERFCRVRNEMIALMNNISENMRNQRATDNDALIEQSKQIELHIADFNQQMGIAIQGEDNNLNAYTLVLHMGQELQQLAFELSSLLTTDKNFRQQL